MNHKLLERQLRLLGLSQEELPNSLENWQNFLSKINKVYSDNDQDRYLLERSLDMSSREMQKRWQTVKLMEEQWRSLGECSPDFIAMTDLSGKITFVNKTKNSTTKDDLIGKDLKLLYPKKHRDNISKITTEAIEQKIQTSTEFSNKVKNLESWLSLRIRPILKEENEITGLVVIETDVTEVRRVAQEIAARKKAEEAVETKSQFLANMSHEIRTPLNGILGMANLLSDQIKGEENTHKIEVIQNCGETLLALINDILDFSKMEAGKIVLENIPFELFSCVKDIVELLGPKASEKGLLLHYKIENSVPNWIYGDTTRVRQILLNLVGNAIKFTERGEILVAISSKKMNSDLHEIRIGVKDTGIGISKEAKKRLFKTFSQVDAATTRKFGGTGLGLSICKGLSEAMGGTIGANGELGQGSEFYFTLIAKEAPTQSYKRKNFSEGLGPDMAEKYPLQILIAEDNRVNQLVVTGFLKRLGYTADVAANGLEAIQSLKRKKYDLILMDCHMPEMDGFEATREISKFWSNDRPKIIAATASTLEDDRKRCEEAGMDDILPKPITINGLAEILHKYSTGCSEDTPQSANITSLFPNNLSVDKTALLDAFHGVEDVLLSSIPSFLESYSKMIKVLKKSATSGNFDAIKKTTHTLKGAAMNLYANKTVRLCEEMEAGCAKNSLVCVKTRIIDLENQETALSEALNEVLKELKKTA